MPVISERPETILGRGKPPIPAAQMRAMIGGKISVKPSLLKLFDPLPAPITNDTLLPFGKRPVFISPQKFKVSNMVASCDSTSADNCDAVDDIEVTEVKVERIPLTDFKLLYGCDLVNRNIVKVLEALKDTKAGKHELTREELEKTTKLKASWSLLLGTSSKDGKPSGMEGDGFIRSAKYEGSKTLSYYITPRGTQLIKLIEMVRAAVL